MRTDEFEAGDDGFERNVSIRIEVRGKAVVGANHRRNQDGKDSKNQRCLFASNRVTCHVNSISAPPRHSPTLELSNET